MNQIYVTYSPIQILLLSSSNNILETYTELDDTFLESMRTKSLTKEIMTDSKIIYEMARNNEIKINLNLNNKILKDWRINRYQKLLENSNLVNDYHDYINKLRKYSFDETIDKVRQTSSRRDELIAQFIHSIDDLQKSINLISNRLSELYSLHFPELVDQINNPITLAKIIVETPNRKNINFKFLNSLAIPKDKINKIKEYKDSSLGGELLDTDLIAVSEYANSLIYLSDRQKELEKWIENNMQLIAPNLTAVAGINVGARLISLMGSLEQLAMRSSSKIQVIGAEKSLYSALRGKGSPPKHGIIFQIPEIGNSPYWLRGKLARAFASKISIAARLDYFDGEFLGEKLRQELREYEHKLRENFPSPPPKKEKPHFDRNVHPAIKRRRRRKNKK